MSRRFAFLLPLLAVLAVAPARADSGPEPPVVRKLPNGLRVAVFPRPGTGFVQVQLSIAAGTSAESDAQRGVAPLVAQMLRMGTSSRSAESFGEDVDRLGGSFASTAQRENAAVGAAFLVADFDAGMELLSDAVINPIFDDERVGRLRDQGVRELLRLHSDPGATAEEQLWAFALPGVAAARTPLGDLQSLFSLNRESLRTFHRDHYRPDQAVLAIAGDVTPARALSAANEWFARWSGQGAPMPKRVSAPMAAGTWILLVDRRDVKTASVRIGWAVPGRDAEDDVARTLGVSLFDDALRSRLASRLPDDAGLATDFGQLQGAGLLDVRFTVPAESASVSIERARRAVRQARDAAPDAERLAASVEQIRASYPMRFATPGGAMTQWLSADLSGSDPDRALRTYPERVGAVDAAAAAEALKRGWDLDRTAIIVVGPAAKLRGPLAKLGTVKELRLDEPPQMSAAAAADTVAPPTPEELKLGEERMKAAIAAHGGADALKAMRDELSEARIRLVLQGRELRGELRQIRKEPMKMVYLTTFESFESRQVLNGDRAWSVTPAGQLQDADTLGVRALQNGFSSDVPHLLLLGADPSTRLAARGTVRIGEDDLWAVEMLPARGVRRTIYLDPRTSMIAAMDQAEEGARGMGGVARRLYRDYRKVGGLQVPYEEERQLDGQTVMNVYVTRLEINASIGEDEFQRPASMPTTPSGR